MGLSTVTGVCDRSHGCVIGELGEDGWIRVQWDNGSTNSYRQGVQRLN